MPPSYDKALQRLRKDQYWGIRGVTLWGVTAHLSPLGWEPINLTGDYGAAEFCGGPTGYRLMLKRQQDDTAMSDPLRVEAMEGNDMFVPGTQDARSASMTLVSAPGKERGHGNGETRQ